MGTGKRLFTWNISTSVYCLKWDDIIKKLQLNGQESWNCFKNELFSDWEVQIVIPPSQSLQGNLSFLQNVNGAQVEKILNMASIMLNKKSVAGEYCSVQTMCPQCFTFFLPNFCWTILLTWPHFKHVYDKSERVRGVPALELRPWLREVSLRKISC